MNLRQKQHLFAELRAKLVLEAIRRGYGVVEGESLRTEEQAALHAGRGRGIYQSNHRLSIASDLMLFLGDVYLTESVEYQEMGEWWESQHDLCRWGGRFSRPDGGHFSLEHQGRM